MSFTDDKTKMGEFANRSWLKIIGWLTVALIIVLNVWLIFTTVAPDFVLDPVFKFLGWPIPAS